MTQRLKHCPNSLNLETVTCEKYISKLFQREKLGGGAVKPTALSTNPQKKVIKHSAINSVPANQNQLSKVRPIVKQQNLPSPKSSEGRNDDVLQYPDNSALVEVTVKTTNPRQRSRSTVADREPWGQLLKQHKSREKVSVFNNFDPLRTLHFLAKELQHHLQSSLPDDSTIQQMVIDMQYALKRIPPEVASMIHLQQAIELFPSKRSSKTLVDDKPEKVKVVTSEKLIQTDPVFEDDDAKKLQKIMEDSTMKLEVSCRQLESLCQQLKNEKQSLEEQLEIERENTDFLKKRVADLEFENNQILSPKINNLEEEKDKLETELNEFISRMETESASAELRSTLNELKTSKSAIEQECNKLKHQLRLSALEKEKYVAVLAVRDRQINEIRTEMTQLQEVVNEQLMELHNNAFANIPSNTNIAVNAGTWSRDQNKENIGDVGDATLSSIHTNDDPLHQYFMKNPNCSFKDLPCGDTLHEMPDNVLRKKDGYFSKDLKMPHTLERPESQSSIRSMINELKKAAFEVLTNPQNHS